MPFFWVGGFCLLAVSADARRRAALLPRTSSSPARRSTCSSASARRSSPAGRTSRSRWPSTRASRSATSRASARGNLYDLLPRAARPRDPELRSNSLGMTETCGPHTYRPHGRRAAGDSCAARSAAPVPGVEHKIVDPETGDDARPRRARRDLRARLQPDAGPLQGRARGHLRRRRLLPHRRRGLLRRRAATSSSRAGSAR